MTDALHTTPPDTGWRALFDAPFPDDQAATSTVWGEQCADQADGFAPTDDDQLIPDWDDDRGYGFGV